MRKGQTDESEIGMSYDELDKIILALESGAFSGCDPELVARVKQMMEASRHKRGKIAVCIAKVKKPRDFTR